MESQLTPMSQRHPVGRCLRALPWLAAAPLLLFASAPAFAQAAEADPTAQLGAAIDTVWVLVAAFLVFFMQAGFAMVEAGFTGAKNAGNIVMKNVMDFAIGALAYWAVGFAIMFGLGNLYFGSNGFFVRGGFEHLGLSIPIEAFWLFQVVFAGTAATIVSGAMAERTRYSAYLVASAVISALIYPVVGHWAWGGGWLSKLGFIDFAGSTVVHSVGGWAGLAGTILLGARLGKYNPDGSVNALRGHNLVLSALGVFILWFGWFGFNPGSTLSGTTPDIALIAMNTNLAAAAGAFTAMLYSRARFGKADIGMTLNGALAGLVAITAGCSSVDPLGAVIIGLGAGPLVVWLCTLLDRIHVDDPVGAIPVHAGAGAYGTLAVGLFATEGGLFYGGGIQQLLIQLAGVAAVFAWTFITSYVLFAIVKATVGLRIAPQEEEQGLDLHEHGAPAYAFEQLAVVAGIGNGNGGTPSPAPGAGVPAGGPLGAGAQSPTS